MSEREKAIFERKRGDKIYLYERYYDPEKKQMRYKYIGLKTSTQQAYKSSTQTYEPTIASKKEMAKVRPKPIAIPKNACYNIKNAHSIATKKAFTVKRKLDN